MAANASYLDGIRKDIEVVLNDNPMPRYAVLDFDNTTIHNDITEAVMAYCLDRGLLSNAPHLMHEHKEWIKLIRSGEFSETARDICHDLEMLAQLEPQQAIFLQYHTLIRGGYNALAYPLTPTLFTGMGVDELRSIVVDTIKAEGEQLGTRVLCGKEIKSGLKPNKEVLETMDMLREYNIDIFTVSASPKTIVQSALDYWDIHMAGCIGMESEIRDGKITKDVITPLSMYAGKVLNIQQRIHPTVRPIVAIGDSMNDEHMLEYARVSVVVDRNNGLSQIAAQKNWYKIPVE